MSSGAPTLVVFAYNFPHRKSQDVMLALFMAGYRIDTVVASDRVDLGIAPPTVRTKLRSDYQLHPSVVAERIGAKYLTLPHNASETVEVLGALGPTVGVVAGARILDETVIDVFDRGIVNLHPGLIPEARGLDAMLWAISRDIPLGVTAHLIDGRVDAGRILLRETIEILEDDTIFDLSQRLYDTQLRMVPEAVAAAMAGEGEPVPDVTGYGRKMTATEESDAIALLPDYIRRHARRP